ncbi:MAG: YbhB/YbcL family Raf kinase inhibitor-like protein [candidate division WOR-3 bacterium]
MMHFFIPIFILGGLSKKTSKQVYPEIIIKSSEFGYGEMIPVKYTCDGENISPPLEWEKIPEETKSFVLICDDPDAPMGTWDHWILFNIPKDVKKLSPGIQPLEKLENGAIHGKNSWGKLGYGGPCPPYGTHRYFFKIYALDTILDLKPGATKKEVLKAMEGHIIGYGELMGKYKRTK